MRKKIVFFVVCICFFCFGITINSYADSNSVGGNNTNSNIRQATLIENYISNYKNKIKDLEKKYEIEDSLILKENYYELDKMVWALRKIENKNISKEIADKIIKEVVRKLKIINTNLKSYIELKEKKYKQKLNKAYKSYTIIAKKISSNTVTLIKKMVVILKKKDKTTRKYKLIINHLVNLEKESKVLNNFGNQRYESVSEMKFNLIQSIKNIRNELKGIKSLLRKI